MTFSIHEHPPSVGDHLIRDVRGKQGGLGPDTKCWGFGTFMSTFNCFRVRLSNTYYYEYYGNLDMRSY